MQLDEILLSTLIPQMFFLSTNYTNLITVSFQNPEKTTFSIQQDTNSLTHFYFTAIAGKPYVQEIMASG